MKLFPLQQEPHTYSKLAAEIAAFVSSVAQRLNRTPRKHQLVQLALFIFHVHAKIATYHKFDRFVYASAAILLAGKLTEQIQYPLDIVKSSRFVLRQKRGLEGEDSEEKLKIMLRKVFQAEINLMISIGFDFDLIVGLEPLEEWEKAIKDNHFMKVAVEHLTKLYHTNIVIYFQPQLLALTALVMAVKSQGLTPQICGWQPGLLQKLKEQETSIQAVSEYYYTKLNHTY